MKVNKRTITENHLNQIISRSIKNALNEITGNFYFKTAHNYEQIWGEFLNTFDNCDLERLKKDMRM